MVGTIWLIGLTQKTNVESNFDIKLKFAKFDEIYK